MNEHLANMIARSEHAHRQTSHTPILDFDRRGDVYTPGWFEQGLSKIRGMMISLIVSLKDRLTMQHEPAMTRETPISKKA